MKPLVLRILIESQAVAKGGRQLPKASHMGEFGIQEGAAIANDMRMRRGQRPD
jgi:hypothetical protein